MGAFDHALVSDFGLVAIGPYGAAMKFHKLFHQGQTDFGTAVSSLSRPVSLVEVVENMWQVFRRNANTRVRN